MSFSRRSFLRSAALSSAAAAALPILTESHLAHAERRMAFKGFPPGAVQIDANENPLGPCDHACAAMADMLHQTGRYDFTRTGKLSEIFAEQHDLKPENVYVYGGSSEPLQFSVLAFTSPTRPYVTADPGYEAGMRAAESNGAPVVKVPLTATHAHDVKAMLAAAPNGGVFYICNPNNPTGTITPREDIEYALANKPAGSILLIDEAYIHFSDHATPSLDMVKAGKDVIVLRTFSKIYGMAGLRCGLAVGRPDLLAKLDPYGQNPMPVLALVSANTSLLRPELVPKRKAINAGIRDQTFAWLTANRYTYIPSESNCFMIDTKRPGHQVMAAMAAKDVYIGRVWPIMPTWVRITVGTSDDMQKFQTAFKQVMDAPMTASLRMTAMPKNNRGQLLS